jgi:hypothetical protein
MAKLIVEIPRAGSSSKNRKSRLRLRPNVINCLDSEQLEDYDSGPARLTMSRNWEEGTKSQGDNLGPLQRFLKSRVGRPWNSVHSEISAKLDNRSLMNGRHVWVHVNMEVARDVEIRDGKLYRTRSTFEVDGLFVHPESGLLCYKPYRRWRSDPSGKFRHQLEKLRLITPYSSESWKNFRIVDEFNVLEKKPGGWFIHVFEPYQPNDIVKWVTLPDYSLRPVYYKDAKNWPTKRRVLTRQLGKRDLKKFRKIINRNPPWDCGSFI